MYSQCCETVTAIKAFTLVLRLNIKFLPGFGGIRRLMCQIWGWSQPQYQNLNSCLNLHTRQDKHTTWWLESKKEKISNLLTFTLFVRETPHSHSKWLHFWNSSKLSPTLLPHMTNKDTRLLSQERMKSTLLLTWLLVACPSLLLLYFTAAPTLPFHPRWPKGIHCHPIMDLCVVQKHRDARPSLYVKKSKYLNYKCLCFFLTWDISGNHS